MNRLSFVLIAAVAALPSCPAAQAQQRALYEKLVATHAKANLVPEALVHRVIVRESKYQPDLVGRGGTIGLMQIKLATARSLGYAGNAEGLRDPDTNLHYGVRYLAGAYRAANGDHDRAVHYYASGYYEVAKRQRLEQAGHPAPSVADAPPKVAAEAEQTGKERRAKSEEVAKAEVSARPEEDAKSEESAATPKLIAAPQTATVKLKKRPRKKLADAKEPVPRPPVSIPAGTTAPRLR